MKWAVFAHLDNKTAYRMALVMQIVLSCSSTTHDSMLHARLSTSGLKAYSGIDAPNNPERLLNAELLPSFG